MLKSLTALAILGALSAPAAAQTAQTAPTASQDQAAKPQMVKKRICEETDNPYSHINRVCHTVMVPAKPEQAASNNPQQQPAPQPNAGN